MCIIAVKPKEAEMISDDIIKNMFNNNDDMAGFAYVKENDKNPEHNEIVIEKGFDTVDKLLRKLHKIDFTGKTLLLHFRIATSGSVNKTCCHPFRINDSYVFAHNGIFSGLATFNDKESDTMVFNRTILQKIDMYELFTGSNKTCNLLFNEILDDNKLAILDKYNNFKLFGNFTFDNGIYYSNSSYKYSYYYGYSNYYGAGHYLSNYNYNKDNDKADDKTLAGESKDDALLNNDGSVKDYPGYVNDYIDPTLREDYEEYYEDDFGMPYEDYMSQCYGENWEDEFGPDGYGPTIIYKGDKDKDKDSADEIVPANT